MPRQSKSKPTGLTINAKIDPEKGKGQGSPDPKSSPMDLQGIDLSSFGGDIGPEFATLPPLPQSPPLMPPSPGHKRDPSRTFLTNFKSRTSPEQDQREQKSQIRQVKDDSEYRPSSSSMSKIYHLRKDAGSTPELSLVGSAENVAKQSSEGKSCGQVCMSRGLRGFLLWSLVGNGFKCTRDLDCFQSSSLHR